MIAISNEIALEEGRFRLDFLRHKVAHGAYEILSDLFVMNYI